MKNRADEQKTEPLALEDAVQRLIDSVEAIREIQFADLSEAVGRVLAEDIFARHDQPPFPRSPLDGYAVRGEDIQAASPEIPVTLTVLGEAAAGHTFPGMVGEREAVRIMTGAPIPDGADCVVRQEETDYGEEYVKVYKSVKSYHNYCFQGEDYGKGTKMLERGMRLSSTEIGILASLGIKTVPVLRRAKAAVITTGDEIVLPGEPLQKGKVFDSNLYMLTARLQEWDIEVMTKERVGDDVDAAAERIRNVADQADLILTTGGVSVGKKDIMHDVLEELGCERLFWRIAVKPGMPTLCARYRGKLLVCLSGNPFGAAVNMEILVRPVLSKLTGREDLNLWRVRAVLQTEFPKKSIVKRYVRARYENGAAYIPEGSNASGVLSSMRGCNCLIEIPEGSGCMQEGEEVWVVLL